MTKYLNHFFGVFVTQERDGEDYDFIVDFFSNEAEAALKADEVESLSRPGEFTSIYIAECTIRSKEAMDFFYDIFSKFLKEDIETPLNDWMGREDLNIDVIQIHEN